MFREKTSQIYNSIRLNLKFDEKNCCKIKKTWDEKCLIFKFV